MSWGWQSRSAECVKWLTTSGSNVSMTLFWNRTLTLKCACSLLENSKFIVKPGSNKIIQCDFENWYSWCFCRGFFYVTSVLYELKQSFYYKDQSTLLSSPKTIRAAVFFPQLLEVERSQLRWIRCPLDLSLGCLPEEVFSDMSCQEETSRQSPGITRGVNLSSSQSNQAGLRR